MIIKYYLPERFNVVKITLGFRVPKIVVIKKIQYLDQPLKGKVGFFASEKMMYNTSDITRAGFIRYVKLVERKK